MDLRVYPQLRVPHNKPYFPYQGCGYRESQVNCGAAGGAGLANWGHAQDHVITHHEFRVAAGNPGYTDKNGLWHPTGLSTTGITSALQHFGCAATRHVGSIWDAAQALQEGKAVGFAVQYSAINQFQGGTYSGDRGFPDGHFLVCKGWRRSGGVNQTGDWDSLLDGRPRLHPILVAPQWAPFRMIRLAAGAFEVGDVPVGTNQAIFVVVEPAT